ncbi:MAG: DUF3943 domain-containing protein [Bdellovibrio sp.]|nr:DUF3943 domain-containing protein [Bdellovibrio sp.]
MLTSQWYFKFLAGILVLAFFGQAHAEEEAPQTEERYVQISRTDFTGTERAINFGLMYAGQWIVYGITQEETIREHGSFSNWITNMWHPEYDKDTYDYNIFKHAISGQLYYQWYRSRGYTEQRAFLWSFMSSLAFEFTIETVTERPSFQDMYLTPVLGSVLGMGMERVSLYFHSKKSWPYRALGFLFNPFSLLPDSQYKFVAVPIAKKDFAGLQVSWSFQ